MGVCDNVVASSSLSTSLSHLNASINASIRTNASINVLVTVAFTPAPTIVSVLQKEGSSVTQFSDHSDHSMKAEVEVEVEVVSGFRVCVKKSILK